MISNFLFTECGLQLIFLIFRELDAVIMHSIVLKKKYWSYYQLKKNI